MNSFEHDLKYSKLILATLALFFVKPLASRRCGVLLPSFGCAAGGADGGSALTGRVFDRSGKVIKPDAIAQGEKGGKTVLQVVEDEAAALGLFVVSKQPRGHSRAWRVVVPRHVTLNAEQAALLSKEYEGTEDMQNAVAAPGLDGFGLWNMDVSTRRP